ncbi:hypothetical protein P152DRAFT_459139 [Eremomyces bilateralis CBS 781.70]|uniref:ABM domain-containing protein n=1 Tax=Eremomyces bilateralis CBS 781.70 TaxID=1392243 RepID=A0A6G1G1I6_9PEZI|nr:uncharacterized protein P152DRAFT_459139 [Eremomyces bilateralis CBS 781.70]KAF1811669.1 hypothetical protein P152DRAFT_459139 [Eremomyces bilateralis CBS 781.70]
MAIEVVAILTPLPGKKQEVIDGLKVLADAVQANEPNCERYQLSEVAGEDELVFIEKYASEADYETHRNSEHYKAAMAEAAKQSALAGAPKISVLKPTGTGFNRKD